MKNNTELQALKGKTFKLNTFDTSDKKAYTCKRLKQTSGHVIIFTNRRTINILPSQLEGFFKHIEYVEGITKTPKAFISKPPVSTSKACPNNI